MDDVIEALARREVELDQKADQLAAQLKSLRLDVGDLEIAALSSRSSPAQAKAARDQAKAAQERLAKARTELQRVEMAREALARHRSEAEKHAKAAARAAALANATEALTTLKASATAIDDYVAGFAAPLASFIQAHAAAYDAIVNAPELQAMRPRLNTTDLLAPAYVALCLLEDKLLAKVWRLETPAWSPNPRMSVAAAVPALPPPETADDAWKGGQPDGPRMAPLSIELEAAE